MTRVKSVAMEKAPHKAIKGRRLFVAAFPRRGSHLRAKGNPNVALRKQAQFAATTLALSLLSGASSASAEPFPETGGEIDFYGQFSPAFLSFDDGGRTTEEIVDNSHSNSRIGFWARRELELGTVSFNFETALGLRQSSLITQGFAPKAMHWDKTNIRKVDLSLETDRYGTFFIGQGSMATDGVAENDLSGTTLVTYASVPDTAGGFRFREPSGNLSNRVIGALYGDFDGGRRGRLRYDTPAFSGLTLSASWGKEILTPGSDLETLAVALKYEGGFQDIKVKGAVGYADVNQGPLHSDFTDKMGSLSLLHTSGLNVTIAAGDRSTNGNYMYGKVGYQTQALDVGLTAISLDFYQGDDRSVSGSVSKAIGLGVVQDFDAANLEVYLGYRKYVLTEPNTSYQDASSTFFGTRWKF